MVYLTSSNFHFKYKLLLFFILLSASCSLSFAQVTNLQQQGWFWQYPKPQANTLCGIVAIDRNTAIAIGESGTIIKTTDSGKSWKVRHYFQGIDKNIGMYFLKNTSIGWIISDNIIWKTLDSGEDWFIFKKDTSMAYRSIYFMNPDTGWIFGSKGQILKTNDGGKSWERTTLYIYDSTPSFGAYYFIDDSTGWLTGYNYYGNAIYNTSNGGISWNRITNIKPPVSYVSDIRFTDKSTGWLVSGNRIIKTTDGGKNWTQSQMPGNVSSLYFFNENTGWVVGGKGQDNHIMSYIIKTTDGGNTWNEIVTGFVGTLHSVDFADGIGWAVGDNGLIMKSTDNGESWIVLSQEMRHLNSIHFTDENNGWAVGDSGVVMHTKDGGENWETNIISKEIKLCSVYSIDNSDVIAIGTILKDGSSDKGIILHSTDAGHSWRTQIIDSVKALYSLSFISKTEGWAAGSSKILRTTDGGNNWQPLNVNTTKNIFNAQLINSQTGWALLGYTNELLKTSDGGNTWITQKTGPSTYMLSLYFIDENNGYAVGEDVGYNIFKTTDGGNSWIPKNLNISCHLSSVFFINKNVGWVAGYEYPDENGIICKTTDGGDSWTKQICPSPEMITSICFINEKSGWAAGDGIFKTINGGTTFIDKNIIIPKKLKLYQNYPNPFNSTTTIRYRLEKYGFVELKIYDILGRCINTLVDKWQNEGEYIINYSANNLPSGIYLCTLTSGEFSENKKLILLK